MVFSGPDREYLLKSARIDGIGRRGERLYFLHALSWAPEDVRTVATVEVAYTDGHRRTAGGQIQPRRLQLVEPRTRRQRADRVARTPIRSRRRPSISPASPSIRPERSNP